MRPARACRECRIGKRKCTPSADGQYTACSPCRKRNLDCSLSLKSHKGQRPVIAKDIPVIDRLNEGQPLPLEQSLEFVDLYFRFIHDRPHSLFHQKSLWRDVQAGTLPQCLLTAICALGCRFSTNEQHSALAINLRKSSRSLFSCQLETISLTNVQTCILLANLYAAEQENGLEALYFGIANRMAQVLRLYESDPTDSPIDREVKCRVWWTLFMADKWCPPGLGLSREIRGIDSALKFPSDEMALQEWDGLTLDYTLDRHDGLWKYMITLVDILGPIQDLNHSLVQHNVDRYQIEQIVANLSDRLQGWHNSLPDYMVMDDTNLDCYRQKCHGGTFVALHLGYHHYSTLLYFQYLDSTSQSTAEAVHYAQECRYHALSYSRLLQNARRCGDCHVVYLTVAYMTMVSSSVLLHLLLLGSNEEIQTARQQLLHNFEALIELKKYWPHLDRITQRLLTFQNACLRSTNKTHTVDKWMVRFLLEHALPLGEKNVIDEADPLTPNHVVPLERTDMLDEAFANLRT